MRDCTQDYFFMMRDGNPKEPILRYDQAESTIRFYADAAIQINEPVKLYFADPIPKKPVLADYHSLPAHVVSKRLKEAMETHPLKGVQFIPAVIFDHKGDPHPDYFIIHVYHTIRCVDLEESVWKPALTPGNMLCYEKLVFQSDALNAIPQESRLVFALAEESRTIVFHESVVDTVIEVDPIPTGFLFCNVTEWTPRTAFENEYYAVEWGL